MHWLAKRIWNIGYPAFLKSHVKIFTPRTWKMACLQRCVIFSASTTTLQVVIGDLVRFSCSFSRTNPWHTTKTALNTASSIHQSSMFVNAANKDGINKIQSCTLWKGTTQWQLLYFFLIWECGYVQSANSGVMVTATFTGTILNGSVLLPLSLTHGEKKGMSFLVGRCEKV